VVCFPEKLKSRKTSFEPDAHFYGFVSTEVIFLLDLKNIYLLKIKPVDRVG